jgi:hypothetical protein
MVQHVQKDLFIEMVEGRFFGWYQIYDILPTGFWGYKFFKYHIKIICYTIWKKNKLFMKSMVMLDLPRHSSLQFRIEISVRTMSAGIMVMR